jgi:hypothetical protein
MVEETGTPLPVGMVGGTTSTIACVIAEVLCLSKSLGVACYRLAEVTTPSVHSSVGYDEASSVVLCP